MTDTTDQAPPAAAPPSADDEIVVPPRSASRVEEGDGHRAVRVGGCFKSRVHQRENRAAVRHAEHVFHVGRKAHFHPGVAFFQINQRDAEFPAERLLLHPLKDCFSDFFIHS